MLAFAGNSLLCRLALGRGLLDAGTFATVRILCGALCWRCSCRARHALPSIRTTSRHAAGALRPRSRR
jgi:hypothetical protein